MVEVVPSFVALGLVHMKTIHVIIPSCKFNTTWFGSKANTCLTSKKKAKERWVNINQVSFDWAYFIKRKIKIGHHSIWVN
jgi:hypothetical protein